MNTCRRVHFIVYLLIRVGRKGDVDFGHYHFPLSLYQLFCLFLQSVIIKSISGVG